jgi:hypothetical protein
MRVLILISILLRRGRGTERKGHVRTLRKWLSARKRALERGQEMLLMSLWGTSASSTFSLLFVAKNEGHLHNGL